MSLFVHPPRPPRTLAALPTTRRHKVTTLANNPALATAAQATGVLDVTSDTFAAVDACLATLGRLRLGVTAARLLLLLAKNGPERCKALTLDLAISAPAFTGTLQRLDMLGLVTSQPGQGREVVVAITPAGSSVLASIVGLTALGQAANVLKKTTPKHPRP